MDSDNITALSILPESGGKQLITQLEIKYGSPIILFISEIWLYLIFFSSRYLNINSLTNFSLKGTKNGPKKIIYIEARITSPKINCFFSSKVSADSPHLFFSPPSLEVNFCALVNFFWLSLISFCNLSNSIFIWLKLLWSSSNFFAICWLFSKFSLKFFSAASEACEASSLSFFKGINFSFNKLSNLYIPIIKWQKQPQVEEIFSAI